MVWVMIVVLIILGYVGQAIFLKSAKKIKEMNLDKYIRPPFRLRVWRAIGIGLIISCPGIVIIGLVMILTV